MQRQLSQSSPALKSICISWSEAALISWYRSSKLSVQQMANLIHSAVFKLYTWKDMELLKWNLKYYLMLMGVWMSLTRVVLTDIYNIIQNCYKAQLFQGFPADSFLMKAASKKRFSLSWGTEGCLILHYGYTRDKNCCFTGAGHKCSHSFQLLKKIRPFTSTLAVSADTAAETEHTVSIVTDLLNKQSPNF